MSDPIPSSPAPYDSIDDTNQKYFIVGNNGGVVAAPSIRIDISSTNPTAKTDDPEYKLTPYATRQYAMTPASYLAYINARKQFTKITDPSNISASGIYVFTGDVAIDSNSPPFNSSPYNIVLVSTGKVTVNPAPDNTFSPAGSVAIVASTEPIAKKFWMLNFLITWRRSGSSQSTGLKNNNNIRPHAALLGLSPRQFKLQNA